MKNLDAYLAFTTIENVIKRQRELDEYSIGRIKFVKQFFESMIKGVKSIVKKTRPYVIVEDLKEILETTGHYIEHKGAVQQEREITKLIKEFEGYVERLNALKKDPKKFYSEETFKRESLAYNCRVIASLYSRKVDEEDAHIRENKDD